MRQRLFQKSFVHVLIIVISLSAIVVSMPGIALRDRSCCLVSYVIRKLFHFSEVRVLGLEHPNTNTVFNNMAVAYKKSGNTESLLRTLREHFAFFAVNPFFFKNK